MTGLASEETAIALKTRWHPLWFTFFFLFRTFVTIDGKTSDLPWGKHVFKVEPGRHEVQVSLGVNSLGKPQGEARIQVKVVEGKTVQLQYRSPFLMVFEEGRIKMIQ